MRDELLKAMREQYFVRLVFRADDGSEQDIPMCWIERVGRTKFEFKPSVVDLWEAPISRVVHVEPAFPKGD